MSAILWALACLIWARFIYVRGVNAQEDARIDALDTLAALDSIQHPATEELRAIYREIDVVADIHDPELVTPPAPSPEWKAAVNAAVAQFIPVPRFLPAGKRSSGWNVTWSTGATGPGGAGGSGTTGTAPGGNGGSEAGRSGTTDLIVGGGGGGGAYPIDRSRGGNGGSGRAVEHIDIRYYNGGRG